MSPHCWECRVPFRTGFFAFCQSVDYPCLARVLQLRVAILPSLLGAMPAPNKGSLRGPGRAISRYFSVVAHHSSEHSPKCLGLSHLKLCARAVLRVSSPGEKAEIQEVVGIKNSRCPVGNCGQG